MGLAPAAPEPSSMSMVGTGAPPNSETMDIFLRKEEASAMIMGDEKLDRRELRDRAGVSRARGRIYNQNGFPRARENFLFESAVTH
jgi:hypothetical protein